MQRAEISIYAYVACVISSLQQWEVVGVGRGDLVADISVFLILLLSCGLINSWGMYS